MNLTNTATEFNGGSMKQLGRYTVRKKASTKKTLEASFLSQLLAMDDRKQKQAFIEQHNPYFYTLFKEARHD